METFRSAESTWTPSRKVHVEALSGLRGVLCLHVVLTNTLRRMHPYTDLCGTLQMPFFFFLSGFVLGLQDGNVGYSPTSCFFRAPRQPEEPPRFHSGNFLWRRFARLIPMYWLAIIACLYLVIAKVDTSWDNNGGTFDLSPGNIILYIMILTCTTTWFVPLYGFVGLGGYDYIDPVVWFVSSIFFCYWCFPAVLPELQRLSRSQKQSLIWWFWILQASLLWGMWCLLDLLKANGKDNKQDSMISATMWPPTRFPVFLMGLLTGLLRITTPPHKHPDNVRVWGMHYLIPAPDEGDDPMWWGRFVNLEFLLVLLGIVVPLMLINVFADSIAYVYLLLMLPIFYVPFTYGLTCDQGRSVVSKCLTSAPVMFLGRISYQLYLWHEPVNLYFMYILAKVDPGTVMVIDYTQDNYNGKGWNSNEEVTAIDDQDSDTIRVYTLPPWSVPLTLAIGIVFAYFMHEMVAEPTRNWLNNRNPFPRKEWSDEEGPDESTSLIPEPTKLSIVDASSTFGSMETASVEDQQDRDDSRKRRTSVESSVYSSG